ncbi:uncharacterized protein LOC116181978 [Photinus pyralis]|uniref:uncharacterized protein LOC116181978 n=1 Tax=Photinus pyralis TaxID=7054 RepID=UPI001266F898|nr:uncharacterized protein LOC116181978 [Photinus pyralis]
MADVIEGDSDIDFRTTTDEALNDEHAPANLIQRKRKVTVTDDNSDEDPDFEIGNETKTVTDDNSDKHLHFENGNETTENTVNVNIKRKRNKRQNVCEKKWTNNQKKIKHWYLTERTAKAFNQVSVDDEAKKYMAINTHLGLLQVNRLQPGINTAPGRFQEFMDRILGETGGAAFLDDVIVPGKGKEDHDVRLMTVLERLKEADLGKCIFGKPSICFLGKIIDAKGSHTSTIVHIVPHQENYLKNTKTS